MSWLSLLPNRLPAWLGRLRAQGQARHKPLPPPQRRTAPWLPEPSIDTYRSAMRQARNGNRKLLVSLYEQTTQDAHLASVLQQRTLATTSRPYQLLGPDGKPAPAAADALAGAWFADFKRLAVRALFWGPGLVQLGPPRPAGGFAYATFVPEQQLWPQSQEVETEGGMRLRYDEPPYADWAVPLSPGSPLGLLAQAVPLVLAKQQALAYWNRYLELFGMPFRAAHTALDDPAQYTRVGEMLNTLGAAGWGVFDKDDRIEFAQGNAAQAGYEPLCRFADEQLSKLVLGQTMTTDRGGSLAQAQVHERIGQALFRADAQWVEEVINTALLPRMERLGMPVAGVRFQFLPDEDALPPALKLDLVRTLLPHYRIPAPWLSAEFGIALQEAEAHKTI